MIGAKALLRTLVGSGVTTCFTNPGTSEMHFVAALDSVPEMRARAGTVRGRGHRRGRRLRADGRPAGGDAAAPRTRAWATGWRTCTTLGGARCRWSTSSATTRPTTGSTTRRCSPTSRRVGAQRVGLGADVAEHGRAVGRDAAEAVAAAAGPPGQVATLILPADVSWSEGAEPAAPVAARYTGAASPVDVVDAVADGAARRRADRACCSADGAARARPAWPPPGSPPRTGAKLLRRDVPDPAGARRRPAGRRADRLPGRDRRRRSSPGCGTWCSSTPRRRCRSSPTRASRATSSPEGCEVHVLRRAWRRRGRRAGRAGRRGRAPAPTRRVAPASPPGAADRRADARRPSARRSARCCPRARSSPTRRTPPG